VDPKQDGQHTNGHERDEVRGARFYEDSNKHRGRKRDQEGSESVSFSSLQF